MTSSGELVIVARIVAPFGRVGEVKAHLDTDYPEEFAHRKVLILSRDGQSGEDIDVERVRFHKGAALLKLRGVDSMDDAEALRGWLIAIHPEERAALGGSSFWIEDVIGLDAVTETGESLGRVTEVVRGPANDVWVTGSAMIPAVREYVVSVDMEARRIVVRDAGVLQTGDTP